MRSVLSVCGAAAALAFASSAVASSTKDVVVTNDATQPVPVTGAVNATVTGSVNATVTGPVNATVTGAVNANVTNDAAHPVPVAGTVTPANTAASPLFVTLANGSAREPFE